MARYPGLNVAAFDDVRRLVRRLPEVEEAPSYRGMPAPKVRGRPFCQLWSPTKHAWTNVPGTKGPFVFCHHEEKEALLAISAHVVFSPRDPAPALLVRLVDVDRGVLAESLEDGYRFRAPRAGAPARPDLTLIRLCVTSGGPRASTCWAPTKGRPGGRRRG